MIAELWSDLRYRLRALVRRADIERELADELRAHLEYETEKYVRAGVPADEARRRAGVSFGGVERIKDDARDTRGLAALEIALQDARIATRALRARPGFALAVVGTLALGIGANAAMFGIVDRMLFRPAPYLRDPATVHRVYLANAYRGKEGIGATVQVPRYHDFIRWTSSFSQLAGFRVTRIGVGSGDASREMPVGIASSTFFEFFDMRPAAGRFFNASEDAPPAGADVAVLGYDYWQIEYGGRGDILGRRVRIGPGMYTVIGVAPKGFNGVETGETAAAWIPLSSYASKRGAHFLTSYNWGWLTTMVRRKPGVTAATAEADLSAAFSRSWLAERSADPSLESIELAKPRAILAPTQPERAPNAGPEARAILLVMGMALVVLLVACANVANLLLARGFGRRREIAVRLAMGVSRSRLLSHLVTESMLLAFFGSLAGLVVGALVGGTLNAMFGENADPSVSIFDMRTLVYCAGITIFVGVVTGAMPAIHAGRSDLLTDLRAGAREGGYRRSRTRAALVVVQATLCVVLLTGAGLFARSLINVRSLPLGFDVDRIVYVYRNMRGTTLPAGEARALVHRLIEAAEALPGVESATVAASVPFYDHESMRLVVPGIDSVVRLGRFQMQLASPDYFKTTGTRILSGRGITVADRDSAPPAIVVSETMARRLWPGRSALGQCIRVGSDTMPCSTVVGIAQDIKELGLTHDPEANYYLPADQSSNVPSGMYVRVHSVSPASLESIRRGLQRLLPGGAYVTATPLSEMVGDQQRTWQLGATMFLAFGALALVLGAIGLYSVIAYGVDQRSRELSIRIALGAGVRRTLALVMSEGIRLAVMGVAAGTVVALWAGRWIESLLFDESAKDPLVFGGVAVVLVIVSVAATMIPALRAAKLDPNVALRAD